MADTEALVRDSVWVAQLEAGQDKLDFDPPRDTDWSWIPVAEYLVRGGGW